MSVSRKNNTVLQSKSSLRANKIAQKSEIRRKRRAHKKEHDKVISGLRNASAKYLVNSAPNEPEDDQEGIVFTRKTLFFDMSNVYNMVHREYMDQTNGIYPFRQWCSYIIKACRTQKLMHPQVVEGISCLFPDDFTEREISKAERRSWGDDSDSESESECEYDPNFMRDLDMRQREIEALFAEMDDHYGY